MANLIKHKRVEFTELFYDLVFFYAISTTTSLIHHLHLYYFGQFDHAMDEEADTQGLRLIYSHYPIFIGLLMTTVSMSFLVNPEANHLFVTLFYYIGLGLFQFAVLSNSKYNKDYLRFDKTYLLTEGGIYLSGLILSLIFHTNPLLVVLISMIMLLALETHFSKFYLKANQAKTGSDWRWF